MPKKPIGCPQCGSDSVTAGTSSYEFQRRKQRGSEDEENVLIATIQKYACDACGNQFSVRTPADQA